MTKVQTSKDFQALLAALRRYRLEQDFTYRELAVRIGIGHSRLFTLLNDPHPTLNERTRYRVESYADRIGLIRDKVSA